jgi:threonine dehydratase
VQLVSIEDIRAAAEGLAGVALRTPLVPAPWAGEDFWLKPESLQPVGSFKLRGGYHAVASLPEERRAAGVVAHSSGNHAQAVAYAARAFGLPCVVVMPDVAEPTKVAATEALGARVVLVPPAQRVEVTAELARREGYAVIPPFDHPDVIAGQGTVGLEIAEDLSTVDVVLVPVGGGGLASGVATAVKALCPSAAVFGVEPELAADARESMEVGRVVVWPTEQTYRTSADGLRVQLSELTLAHLSARLDGILTVSEEEILGTAGRLARESRLVVEPSGAVSVAGYLHRRADLPPGRTVAVISGGNLAPALLAKLVEG